MNQHFTRMPTHALLDFSSKAILAIDRFPGVIAFLTDCTPHSFAVFNINIPNYLNESPLKDTSPEQYPEWVFDPASRVVKKNPSPNVDMLRDKSKLAMHKGATILPIMRNIIIALSIYPKNCRRYYSGIAGMTRRGPWKYRTWCNTRIMRAFHSNRRPMTLFSKLRLLISVSPKQN